MRFQKHLVISPGAAEWRSVDIWMNGLSALLKNDSQSGGAYGFIVQYVPLTVNACLIPFRGLC